MASIRRPDARNAKAGALAAMIAPAASGPTVRDAFIAAPVQTIARGSAARGRTSCTSAE